MGNNKKKKKTASVKRKPDIKKLILIALQALSGALIGVCFFIYNTTGSLTVFDSENVSDSVVPSFYELSSDYYESSSYVSNMEYSIKSIIAYAQLRKTMECDGLYDGMKNINVGEYAHRNDKNRYTGPEASYFLKDLINWAQNGINHDYKAFFSWDEYNAFLGLGATENGTSQETQTGALENNDAVTSEDVSLETDVITGTVNDANGENSEAVNASKDVVATLDTINNTYKSVEGLGIEDYVSTSEGYTSLAVSLEKAANELAADYIKYLEYNEAYLPENTNIRYCVVFSDEKDNFYTNVSEDLTGLNDNKITDYFKKFGEYVYICPTKLDFLTNTPIQYVTIKDFISEEYAGTYQDDTRIWVSLDTDYPAKDLFYENYKAFSKTVEIIPWIVFLGALSVIAFISLFVVIILREKSIYSQNGAKDNLGEFDKLPIEISLGILLLLIGILFMAEYLLIGNRRVAVDTRELSFAVPMGTLLFLDIYVALLFVYGFVRRIYSKNIYEDSITSLAMPYISNFIGRIKGYFWKVYDSSDVAIRTWSAYLFFLVFNIFFASMYMFGKRKIFFFICILGFDIVVGIVLFKRNRERKSVVEGIEKINAGDYTFKIDNSKMHGANKDLADAVNNIGAGIKQAVETSTKDEKLKADLITNVSHDIKTPLTSIINYVDLLKRENITDDRIVKYISVLDEKSQRLKQLTFDLVEASKITSGNITLEFTKIDFVEFLKQTLGEFEEKFEEKGFELVMNVPKEPVYIEADPRRMWRVIENLFNNICKYALENTRVYLDLDLLNPEMKPKADCMELSVKNISKQKLNIPSNELTERFIRGDVSRSTEGSGLGLSIAKSLTEAQNGNFNIYLDGDLFKVTLTFPLV